MRLNNIIHYKNIKDNDKGFSLVEILIAVTILAIVFTPVIRSFMTSTFANSRAQEIQNATSLAEKIMEDVKGKTLAELKAAANSVSSNTISVSSNGVAKDFEDVELVYRNQTATNGATFDAVVTIKSSEYAGESVSRNVADANIRKIPSFDEIDTSKNAVLSWELSRYDGSAFEVILDRNAVYDTRSSGLKQLMPSEGDRYGIWWGAVLFHYRDKFVKNTTINITKNGSKVDVGCDVSYEKDPDKTVKFSNGDNVPFEPVKYSLYSGSFDIIHDTAEDGTPIEVYPDIYIFYSFMFDDEEVVRRREDADAGGQPNLWLHAEREFLNIDAFPGYNGNVYYILQRKIGSESKYTMTCDDGTLDVKYHLWTVEGNPYDLHLLVNRTIKNIAPSVNCFSIGSGNLYTNLEYDYTDGTNTYSYDGNLYSKKTSDKVYQINVKLYKSADYAAGDTSKPQADITSTMQIKD